VTKRSTATWDRPDQAAGRGIEASTGEQRGDAGTLLQRREGVGPVGDHGEPARAAERCRDPHHGRRRVERDRAAVGHEREQLGCDLGLGACSAAATLGEGLRSEQDRAAAHPAGRAALLELGEVAPDRHVADAELRRGEADRHHAVGAQPFGEPAQPFLDGRARHDRHARSPLTVV
jgi:hypothetical protein